MKKADGSVMSQRLLVDYPWPIWAMGWLAVLKAVFWLGSEPASLPDRQMVLMGYKYLGFMLPFLVCGFGAWAMKKWAAWGLIALCVLELLLFLISPTARASLALNTTSSVAYAFSLTIFVINGPPSAVLILLFSPALVRR